MGFLSKLFGTPDEREVKKIQPLVDKIDELGPGIESLSDVQLREKTQEFKDRLAQGETLDDLLPEAFAVVREASKRVLGMRQYRVQLIGGIILHQGRIAEMKTGEGKTLVATLPAYLNALSGKGVHIVTVNDYLAKRDRDWMGKVYEFLDLTVGCIVYGLNNEERRKEYAADITYGTNNQFGFDYLRDNMVVYKNEMVQRELNYAIVDEVDSILVDEARTPLIISGEGDKSTDMYRQADQFAKGLSMRKLDPSEDKTDPFNREMVVETVDIVVDEKRKTASLTEQGTEKAEKYFALENLSDPENMEVAHHINQALKARHTMHRDIDYVVKDGEVLIVDEFTGRIMQGRRYSDGLHQAIEAKENVSVQSESKTLATITFQNYFRMFSKLAGMTGTAKTEEAEFSEIYNMDVVEIPTNKPMVRKDLNDVVYLNEVAKFRAIVDEIERVHQSGQPILVGTISIEKSELLSQLLKRKGIRNHEVLNAKYHDKEAEIVAQAGTFGTITIATNMAGRGTDIVLGGNPDMKAKLKLKKDGMSDELLEQVDSFAVTEDVEILEARSRYKELREQFKVETDADAEKVIEAGGLYIIGTERHESRRIDNQLRGRSGRQGDPGTSKFFISLEDDLMRLFGGETIQRLIDSGNFPEDEPIEAKILTGAIERAQRKVEANNFSIRKHVLEYDNVMNLQRNTIYKERKSVLDGENMKDYIMSMLDGLVDSAVDAYTSAEKQQDWELEALFAYLNNICLPKGSVPIVDVNQLTPEGLKTDILKASKAFYEQKERELGEEMMRELERMILLRVVDTKWMDHIDAMDQLRQGIGLRSYGQENPVRAYEKEGFDMFEEMNHSIVEDTLRTMFHMEKPRNTQRVAVARPTRTSDEPQKTVVKGKKIGVNDPCPCGSGKKYKKCCGSPAKLNQKSKA
ncbi:MAG: preprotein translocase subunit SecA [Tissierellia bacterium]|nr:preprotein translocase subunit SecA [Tissierellia bacterium]